MLRAKVGGEKRRILRGISFHLFGERPARRLAVSAQHQRFGIFGRKVFRHQMGPEPARRTQFRDFLRSDSISTTANQ